MTRMYKGGIGVKKNPMVDETGQYKLSERRTGYTVMHIIPIYSKQRKLNLLFIVFENHEAKFFDMDNDMKMVH